MMSEEIPRAKANAEAVYGSASRDELEAVYDRWAGEYDQDASEYFGYLGPELALEHFAVVNRFAECAQLRIRNIVDHRH